MLLSQKELVNSYPEVQARQKENKGFARRIKSEEEAGLGMGTG